MNCYDTLLSPAPKETADYWNYTWHNGKGDYPINAGYVFKSKELMAEQINSDYPSGKPLVIKGCPERLGENSVIGGDGFGWYGTPPKRFPHIGGIVFGEEVEIGSCTTIDRGSLGDTVIGSYVKIDNGVHVGHNAVVGDRSILTAHCIIGGSASIGEDCWIGLGAIIKNQIKVGDGATVGMGAIVVKDVPAGVTVVGNPARILE